MAGSSDLVLVAPHCSFLDELAARVRHELRVFAVQLSRTVVERQRGPGQAMDCIGPTPRVLNAVRVR